MSRAAKARELESRMRADWDTRASEDYKLHIATGHSLSDEMFRDSGRRDLETVILDGIDLDPSATGLEIGCGVGRLLVPLSEKLSAVRGVDISPVMVEKSREFCAARRNIRVEVTDGSLRTVPASSLDFVFSFIVFQHIPDRDPIRAYVQEVARCLREGGLFRFQVDGRWERFRDRPPDTYEGVKFSPEEARGLLDGTGLSIVEEWGEETHYHRITARRGHDGSPRAALRRRGYDPTLLAQLFSRLGLEEPEARARLVSEGASGIRRQLGPLEERWVGADDAAFVREASRILLGREIDEEGEQFHVRILSGNFEDRSALLDTILTSLEFENVVRPFTRQVPWYRASSARAEARGRPSRERDDDPNDLFSLADLVERTLPDGPPEDVVRAAFLGARGAVPDGEALAHYARQLSSSAWGRRLLVRELLESSGAEPPPPPSSRATARLLSGPGIAAPTKGAPRPGESFEGEGIVAASLLEGLRTLDDRRFVEAAYLGILGRSADEAGAAYYAGKLSARELDRALFVRELLWSDELRK